MAKQKKRARIKFNHEQKIVDITDKLYEQSRLTDNLSEMVMEESKFFNIDEKYKHIPIINLPEEVKKEIFEETELERVCEKNTLKLDRMLLNVVKKHFYVTDVENMCILNSFRPSEQDLKDGIVIDIEATDMGFEDWNLFKSL